MIELTREHFLRMITQEELPSGEWVAVVLSIPTGILHDCQIDDNKIELIIDSGAVALKTIGQGMYCRVGWASYFAVTQLNASSLRGIFSEILNKVASEVEFKNLWRFSIEDSSKPLHRLFSKMESEINSSA